MSELDQSSLGSHDAARTRDAEIAAIIGERVEREGLPRNYRMRADAHYVDQLDRPAGPVVRMIATRHIDATDLPPTATLSPLSQSIAAHGMLQPLLVRRAGTRYQLIAGRKRLAAAVGGGLADVPCIVHEVSESGAHAIADAERVHGAPSESVEKTVDETSAVFPVLSQDLARIGSLADVLEQASTPFQHRAAGDFLKAETWRAEWLVNAAAIVSNPQSSGRTLSVGRALDRVRNGFEPEVRLARLQLEISAASDAAEISCDERLATIVTGTILATLAWLHKCESPRIEVRVDSPSAQTLRVQTVQRLVPAPSHAITTGPAGSLAETIAFASARAFAASMGGSLELAPAGQRGTLIQMAVNQP